MKKVKYPISQFAMAGAKIGLMIFLTIFAFTASAQTKVPGFSSGTTSYSKPSGQIYAYPNPATNYVTVEFDLIKSGPVAFAVFTSTGKLVYQNKAMMKSGHHSFKLDLTKYPSGQYVILIDAGYAKMTTKVTKL